MTSANPPTGSAGTGGDSGESRLCDTWLSAAEAGDILQLGTYRTLQLCRAGELPAYKPGKAWLIRRADLDDYIKAHPGPAKESA